MKKERKRFRGTNWKKVTQGTVTNRKKEEKVKKISRRRRRM